MYHRKSILDRADRKWKVQRWLHTWDVLEKSQYNVQSDQRGRREMKTKGILGADNRVCEANLKVHGKISGGSNWPPCLSLLCSAEYQTRFWYTEDLDTSFVGGSWLIFLFHSTLKSYSGRTMIENTANYYSTKHNFFLVAGGLCWVFAIAQAFLQLPQVGATLYTRCGGFS